MNTFFIMPWPIRKTCRIGALGVAVIMVLSTFLYAEDPNYVETTTKNVDGSGTDIVSRSYSDGEGKAIQSISKINNTTTSFTSVVNGAEYDDEGRLTRTVKSFGYTNPGGALTYIPKTLSTDASCASSYYNGSNAPAAENYPFSEIKFYSDPLDRVSEIGAPGKAFSLDVTGHAIKKWYMGVTGTSDPSTYFDNDGFIKIDQLTDGNLSGGINNAIQTATLANPIACHLTVTQDPNGNFTQELKDVFGNVKKTWSSSNLTDPTKTAISTFSYNMLNQITKEEPPPTQGRAKVDPTTYVYNTLGQLETKTTPDGHSVSYTYDVAGRLMNVTDANMQAKTFVPPVQVSGSVIPTLKYEYDNLGRVITMSRHWDADPVTASGTPGVSLIRIRNIYDEPEAIRLYLTNSAFPSEITSLDNIISSLSNTSGRVVASLAYDDNFSGNETTYSGKVIDVFSYDGEGNVSRKYKSIPGLPLQTMKYGYDIQGKILADTIEYGTTPIRIITKYTYDANGRLWIVSRDNGSGTFKEFARYTYDDLGKLTKKTFVNGTASRDVGYSYNICDWVKEIKTSDNTTFNEKLCYESNDLSELPPGLTFQSQFNGNISRAQYQTGVSASGASLDLVYQYDNINRLTSVINNKSYVSKNIYDGTFQYLNDGRILQKNEGPDQESWAEYVYDGNTNKLKGITGSAKDPSNNYEYDPNGNMILDRSKKMVVIYDWRNMPVCFSFYNTIPTPFDPKTIDGTSGVNKISDVVMIYDASGNRVKKEVLEYTTTCVDPSPTTKSLLITNGSKTVNITPTGDFQTCLTVTTINKPTAVRALEISKGGNMLFTISDDAVQISGQQACNNTQSAQYGDMTMTLTSNTALPNAAISGDGAYLAITGSFTQPASNEGVAYVEGSHVFTKNSGISSYDLSYVNFADGVSRKNGNYEFYIKDHLGSTRAVMGEGVSNWQMQEAMNYLAYGTLKSLMPQTADNKARRQFTGKEVDEEGGMKLDYFGKRYYDAEVGLWITPDPEKQFWNLYRYTTNPIGFVDLKGLEDTYILNVYAKNTPPEIRKELSKQLQKLVDYLRKHNHTVYYSEYATIDDFIKMVNDEQAKHGYLNLHGAGNGNISFDGMYISILYINMNVDIDKYEFDVPGDHRVIKATNTKMYIDFFGCYLQPWNKEWREKFPNFTAHYLGGVYDINSVPAMVKFAKGDKRK
jgi:RHS repeat-associated protein